jgi:hypothetical protein
LSPEKSREPSPKKQNKKGTPLRNVLLWQIFTIMISLPWFRSWPK